MREEGIFRLSGGAASIKQIREAFDSGTTYQYPVLYITHHTTD